MNGVKVCGHLEPQPRSGLPAPLTPTSASFIPKTHLQELRPGRSHTEEKSQEVENWSGHPVLSLVLVKPNSSAMTLEESSDGC